MRIAISQIYTKVGINFPFSHQFQKWLSSELTSSVRPSRDFIRRYGEDFTLVFNMSAKPEIVEMEIKGPTVYKKTKDVEYTIFLPYDAIKGSDDETASAIKHLLDGIVRVLTELKIEPGEVSKRTGLIIEHVCSDPMMISRKNT
jgi:hypothetical protein